MKNYLKKFLRNKYAVTAFGFLVWMTFFNDIDLLFIGKSKLELMNMKKEVQHFDLEIEHTREALHDLTTNKETLEKFAREQYFMKRDNEDLFVIREKDLEKGS